MKISAVPLAAALALASACTTNDPIASQEALLTKDDAPLSEGGALGDKLDATGLGEPDPVAMAGRADGDCGKLEAVLERKTAGVILENRVAFPAEGGLTRRDFSAGARRFLPTREPFAQANLKSAVSYDLLHYCENANFDPAAPARAAVGPGSQYNVVVGSHRVQVKLQDTFRGGRETTADSVIEAMLTDALPRGVMETDGPVLLVHVLVESPRAARQVRAAWLQMGETARGRAMLMVTRLEGASFMLCDAKAMPGVGCAR